MTIVCKAVPARVPALEQGVHEPTTESELKIWRAVSALHDHPKGLEVADQIRHSLAPYTPRRPHSDSNSSAVVSCAPHERLQLDI